MSSFQSFINWLIQGTLVSTIVLGAILFFVFSSLSVVIYITFLLHQTRRRLKELEPILFYQTEDGKIIDLGEMVLRQQAEMDAALKQLTTYQEAQTNFMDNLAHNQKILLAQYAEIARTLKSLSVKPQVPKTRLPLRKAETETATSTAAEPPGQVPEKVMELSPLKPLSRPHRRFVPARPKPAILPLVITLGLIGLSVGLFSYINNKPKPTISKPVPPKRDKTPETPLPPTKPPEPEPPAPATPLVVSPPIKHRGINSANIDVSTTIQGLQEIINRYLAESQYDEAFKVIEDFPFKERYPDEIELLRIQVNAALEKEGYNERLKETFAHIQTLIQEEKVIEAEETLKPWLESESRYIRAKAKALKMEIDKAREHLIKVVLPGRRKAYAELFLTILPYLEKRDYAGASKVVQKAVDQTCPPAPTPSVRDGTGAAQDAGLKTIFNAEQQRLESLEKLINNLTVNLQRLTTDTNITFLLHSGPEIKGTFRGIAGETIRVWLDEGGEQIVRVRELATGEILKYARPDLPLKLELLLYETDFAGLKQCIASSLDEHFRIPPQDLNDFHSRWEMVEIVVRDKEYQEVLNKADKYREREDWNGAVKILEDFKHKYQSNPIVEDGPALPLSDALVEQLKKIDALIAECQQLALATRLKPTTLQYVNILLNSSEEGQKVEALKALSKEPDKNAVPYITKCLKDQSVTVRLAVCNTLSGYKDKSTVWPLIEALDDPVAEVGLAALNALKEIGIDLSLLNKKTHSDNPEERRLAIVAMGLLDKSSVSTLTTALKDPVWGVRKAAAIGLGKMEVKPSGAPLLAALKEETYPEVRVALVFALKEIKYQPAVSEILKLAESEGRYRKDYIQAVGQIGIQNTSDIDQLKTLLTDKDPWIRYYTIDALKNAGVKMTAKELEPLFKDDSWMVRASAVAILAKAQYNKDLETIILKLNDPTAEVRYTAMQSLANWPDREVLPTLINNLDKITEEEGYQMALNTLKLLTNTEQPGKDKTETQKLWETWWKNNGNRFKMPK